MNTTNIRNLIFSVTEWISVHFTTMICFILENPILVIGFSTIVIGICTLALAYRQWRISKDNLRLNLYEKRYEIYLKALKFVANISVNQKISLQDTLEFRRTTDQSKFLFEPEIQEYMDEIFNESGQYSATTRSLEPLQEKVQLGMELTSDQFRKKNELENKKTELLDYFEEQSRKVLTERFNKYLNFKNVD